MILRQPQRHAGRTDRIAGDPMSVERPAADVDAVVHRTEPPACLGEVLEAVGAQLIVRRRGFEQRSQPLPIATSDQVSDEFVDGEVTMKSRRVFHVVSGSFYPWAPHEMR